MDSDIQVVQVLEWCDKTGGIWGTVYTVIFCYTIIYNTSLILRMDSDID